MLRRQLKRQRQCNARQAASATAAGALATGEGVHGDETDDWDASVAAEVMDDALAAMELLASRSAAGFAAMDVPPVVLWHQLYTVFPNRTFIDQSIHRLRNDGAVVTFRVPTGADEVAILPTAAYVGELEKHLVRLRRERERQQQQPPADASVARRHDALARFIRVLPSIQSLPSIPSRALVEALEAHRRPSPSSVAGARSSASDDAEVSREDIVWLQRLGFLRQRTRLDDEVVHLSLPGVGKLVRAVTKTRATVLATLKRTTYKETAEAQLKKRRLRDSVLDWDYHLSDVEGLGLVRRTSVSSGRLVSLVSQR